MRSQLNLPQWLIAPKHERISGFCNFYISWPSVIFSEKMPVQLWRRAVSTHFDRLIACQSWLLVLISEDNERTAELVERDWAWNANEIDSELSGLWMECVPTWEHRHYGVEKTSISLIKSIKYTMDSADVFLVVLLSSRSLTRSGDVYAMLLVLKHRLDEELSDWQRIWIFWSTAQENVEIWEIW